jgi:catechol 2,3-dioxygenase-like lactoylglutathione lyase family enzyme
MIKLRSLFSGFSITNLQQTQDFYTKILGLEVTNNEMGLEIKLPDGGHIFVYQKDNHIPATYTILNFEVESIDEAIDQLISKGITFERYDNMPAPQDEKGVLRGLKVNQGPDIAWFKDPSGNILSVLQNK